jgi:hypothetical protein
MIQLLFGRILSVYVVLYLYFTDKLLFYFERTRRLRVVMVVLCTFAKAVAEKYVYTYLFVRYVTSASLTDGVFRRDGAACMRNIQLY